MRIDRILAESGLGTRKDVGQLIRQGQVALDQVRITDPKQHIRLEDAARLTVSGSPFIPRRHLHYILHKPVGVLSATQDPHEPVASDFLPEETRTRKLVPVGRLDKDSEGLLFFTNDGQLNHRLTSPKHRVAKHYLVDLELLLASGTTRTEGLNATDVAAFAAGTLRLDDKDLLPAELEILDPWQGHVVLYEGRYRQVRRMFELLGLKVRRLQRVREAGLELGNLAAGDCRMLTDAEATALYEHVGLDDPDATWRRLAPQTDAEP